MSELPVWRPFPASQLRLFRADAPEAGDNEITSGTRIRAFVEGYYIPRRLRKACRETIREHRTSLKYFVQACGNLPLEAIDGRVLSEFVSQLEQMPGKAPGTKLASFTVAKHIRNVEGWLTVLGPASRSNRCGVGLFPLPPFFPEAYEVAKKHPRRPFTREEIDALIRHADAARLPEVDGIKTADWWAGLFEALYLTGMRIDTALRFERAWCGADGCAPIPPEAYKGGEVRELFFCPEAREMLARLHPADAPERRRTFAGVTLVGEHPPFDARDRVQRGCCRRHLDDLFKGIMRAAGVAVRPQHLWHGFRRALADEFYRVCPSMAAAALGHASLAVTKEHYIVEGRTPAEWYALIWKPTRRT